MNRIRSVLAGVLALSGLSLAAPQDRKSPLVGPIEYLWPKGAPLATGDAEKDKPNLSLYLAPAEKANGSAVVVCPGGGYGGLAKGHEGHDIATWLNARGVSAFVLTYRVSPYRHPCPMLDVQRAVRTVRARATEWKVDPKKIGVWGFSAGGHLVSTAVTHFDDGKADAEDPIDRASSRPDFGILCYPVIALDKPYTHQGSKKNLLGDKVNDPELVEDLSCEKRVTEKTPPCFLVHTTNDTGVPPENSIDFYLALRKAKVPCELHIYERGPHGLGLGNDKIPEFKTWPDRLADWLGVHGFLPKP
ncbi:MAG TPA: alpha/beta hydrolase [Planctomycetota bacterium]|nr:alpha/beta hydrolase [Planctomycetota bacterium]